MAGNKTTPTAQSVERFIEAIPDDDRRKDCRTLLQLMQSVTGEKPKMWGSSMVGWTVAKDHDRPRQARRALAHVCTAPDVAS